MNTILMLLKSTHRCDILTRLYCKTYFIRETRLFRMRKDQTFNFNYERKKWDNFILRTKVANTTKNLALFR